MVWQGRRGDPPPYADWDQDCYVWEVVAGCRGFSQCGRFQTNTDFGAWWDFPVGVFIKLIPILKESQNPHPLSQRTRKKGGATDFDEFLLLRPRVFVDRAAFHYEIYVLQHFHIGQRVLAYGDDVRVLSWLDCADVALAADQVGGA